MAYLVWHKNGLNPNHQYDSVSLLSLLVTVCIFTMWYLQKIIHRRKYSLLRSFEVSVPHNVSHHEPYQGRYSSIVKVLHHDVTTPHTTSSTISNLSTLGIIQISNNFGVRPIWRTANLSVIDTFYEIKYCKLLINIYESAMSCV